MRHVIVLGDEDGSVGTCVECSMPDDVQLLHATSIDAALADFPADRPALAVIVLRSCDSRHAFAPLVAVKRFDADVPVLVVAPHDEIARAQALKLGAAGYVTPPLDPGQFSAVLAPLLRNRVRREMAVATLPDGSCLEHQMIFDPSARMEHTRRIIDTVAHLDCTVLVRGESGTGKELVARALAAPATARGKPFVKVNCAALPSDLLEAELFGYERGAFTGAVQRKPGKFEFAHQGTMFLDEIGEMSAPMQAKVLQVLQDGEFSRLGGTHDTRVDVRIIAATHRNLEQMISEGQFREDLFFRLNVIPITLPPLRERPDSIPLLANHFLRKYAAVYKRPHVPLSATMTQQFLAYSWPGNIREMQNIIQRMVILGVEASSRDIAQAMATPIVRRNLSAVSPPAITARYDTSSIPSSPADVVMSAIPNTSQLTSVPLTASAGPTEPMASLKDAARLAAQGVERELIVESLRRMRWNRKETAKLLGVSYKTLLAKIRENGLDDETLADAGQQVG